MTKKIISMILLVLMLVSVSAFADEQILVDSQLPADEVSLANIPKISIDISEPDEEGCFSAKFTLFNTTYKGIIASFKYNTEAAVPVDFETKEPTTEYIKFAKCPTVAKNLETGEDIKDWSVDNSSVLYSEEGIISFIHLMNIPTANASNSLITASNQILAPKEGLAVSEFYFKSLSDKTLDFELLPTEALGNGLLIANNTGALPYILNITVPEKFGESKVIYSSPELAKEVSREDFTSDDEKNKLTHARALNVIFLGINNYATVSSTKLKWIDKNNKNVFPFIKGERTLVPLRFLAEEFGAGVTYEDETGIIKIKTADTELILTVGEKEYTNDGVSGVMEVPAEVIEGRTFVPVRFVSEALNKSVTWLEKEQIIIITPKDYPWAENNEIEKELYSRAQLLMSPMVRDFVN